MTPKEKAQELIDKMQLDWACDSCHNDWTKECALIAVDEIMKEYNPPFIMSDERWNYWQEVKQEIQNL